ncbi:MAG: Hsp70 family protein, partial [Candidatus Sulfotelmatobacter sp.]
ALVNASGQVELGRFSELGTPTDSYRSLLYLERVREGGVNALKSWSGPAGIEHYLSGDGNGRLMQSLKSFLSSRSLQTTDVFGRRHTLISLIARILRDLREQAENRFGIKIDTAIAGRPVTFVGAENEDDNQYAETRLREAFREAGYESVEFELEPVAAARSYESTLDHDQLILIGDFGGGTSDFSLLRVGPTIRRRGRTVADLLGNAGVGLAGDAFDAKIVRHLVAPALGEGSQMRSLGKLLTVPGWVFSKLERWHYLSLLKARDTMEMLRGVQGHALEPEKIKALIHLIKEDLGFRLHRAVQAVKCDLSYHPAAMFKFLDGVIEIEAELERSVFECWIAEELEQIQTCVDSLLIAAGARREDVDAVFLTGGSSFVPAVRRIFETRFGSSKLRAGNEFTSVAHGLALKSR